MSFLIPGLRRSLLLTTPLIMSTPLLMRQLNKPIYCDGPDMLSGRTSPLSSSTNTGTTGAPGLRQSGLVNPKIVRQVSMGSILGVMCGLGVSVFSKPLAVLLGLGVVVVQLLSSRGIHIIPTTYLSNRLKNTNFMALAQSNPALKLSFGLTFALAAFAEF